MHYRLVEAGQLFTPRKSTSTLIDLTTSSHAVPFLNGGGDPTLLICKFTTYTDCEEK